MIDKAITLEGKSDTTVIRSILRLLNNHSHYQVIPSGEIEDNVDTLSVLPDILKDLLEFIWKHDYKHFNNLALKCDKNYNENIFYNTINEVKPKKKVRLYNMAASAGTEILTYDDLSYESEEYEVSNLNCDFAVRIQGDSIEPNILDESIVLVKESPDIDNYKTGIFYYNDKLICKKKVKNEEGFLLISSNKQYPVIKLGEDDQLITHGEVIEIIHTNL